MSEPIIITACLDAATARHLDDLRRHYFPPGRTVIGAHLTLFHAIPAAARATVLSVATRLCADEAPFCAALPALYSLGRGFAVRVQSAKLIALHARLALPLADLLTPQDAQPFRPHVTLANKMAPAEAKAMLRELQAMWYALEARIEGLGVWRYMGPDWQLDVQLPFTGASSDG